MEKTIIEMLEGIAEYRKGNAIRHKLVDILMIGLLTIICNGNERGCCKTAKAVSSSPFSYQ